MCYYIYDSIMKNRGFTLVELIAVIAILAVILLLSFGVFTTVQQSVLDSQYNNLIIDIEAKAEDYARDIGTTDILYINVDFLIKNGYIQADDDNYIYDPRDNSIMNCYKIHIMFADGQYTADFLEDENDLNEDNTCNTEELITGEIDILCNGGKCSNDWVGNDITLTLSGKDSSEILNSTVEWTSLLGTYVIQGPGEEKKLEIIPETVLDTIYSVTVKINDKVYYTNKNIKIDKEGPSLIENTISIGSNQKLSIDASDLSGSGITGIALANGSCNDVTYSMEDIPITSSGKYTLCMQDAVGNVSSKEIQINKVKFNYNDLSNPNPREEDMFYLVDDPNINLIKPTRPGYTFEYWTDSSGNRVHSLEDLPDGAVINGKWQINDIAVPVDKIDTSSVGVTIQNRVNIILLLDTSGSMKNGNKSPQLRAAVNNTINSMNFNNGSTITILQFTHVIKTYLMPTNNKIAALNFSNSYDPQYGDDENFALALNWSYNVINQYNMEKDKTFIIFFTDGNDVASTPAERKAAYQKIRSHVSEIFAVGLDMTSEGRNKLLDVISSSENYFDASSAQANLEDIFWQIQEEIREEVTINSVNGLINLPNLYVSSDYPFIIYVNDVEYKFTSISQISDILTGTYNLDLAKVDNKYKLNGDLSSFNFTYYYN
mgnify:CR=1 FL=1